MIRLWYLDGNYQDVPIVQFQYYMMQSDLVRWEFLTDEEDTENGKPSGRHQ